MKRFFAPNNCNTPSCVPTVAFRFKNFMKSTKLGQALMAALAASFFIATTFAATPSPAGLRSYYALYYPPYDFTARPLPLFPPEVHVTAGGSDPAPVITRFGSYYSVTRLLNFVAFVDESPWRTSEFALGFLGPITGPCAANQDAVKVPGSLAGGTSQTATIRYKFIWNPIDKCGDYDGGPGYGAPKWIAQDQITYLAPVRRKASDGSDYDASPMVIVRNGEPWMTYFFGYRLGLVASESNWNVANLPKVPSLADWPDFPTPMNNFELAKLPPPFVEGEVVEYVNFAVFPASKVGHFFYAANANEQAALDVVPTWFRTGQTFKNGGYVSVCRFYGSASPGPNTHVYSADENECKVVLPSISVLHDEGTAFRASRPIPSTATNAVSCPTATIPVYRLYNNPAGRAFDSNHRYVTDATLAQAMVRAGWVDEGLVMCVPQ